MVSVLLRRQLPIALVWILMVPILVNYFAGGLEGAVGQLSAYGSTLGSLTIITSSISYVIRTLDDVNVWRRTPKEKRGQMYIVESIYSLALYFILFVIFLATSATSAQVNWVMTYVVIPSWNAGVAYTACFIAIGIWYHWRIRNFETALFVVATVLVLVGRAPVTGGLIPQIPIVGQWVENYLVSPVSRTFTIMSCMGALAMLINVARGKAAGFD